MRYTIEGFSQEYAMRLYKTVERNGKQVEIRVDCTDLVILRWFVDFYPKMKKMTIDGEEYAFVSYKRLCEDLPLININKRAFTERLKKLAEFNILTYKYVTEGGAFTFYGFGTNYEYLISSGYSEDENEEEIKKDLSFEQQGLSFEQQGVAVQTARGLSFEQQGVAVQTAPINNNINNSSIRDYSINNNSLSQGEQDGLQDLPQNFDTRSKAQKEFFDDFDIKVDNYNADLGDMDFNKIYAAYVDSPEFLQVDEQARYLSWICRNYQKIIGGYYKQRQAVKKKEKKKTISELWKELYDEEVAAEQAQQGGTDS